jgi:predicted nucleic acid-binding protein
MRFFARVDGLGWLASLCYTGVSVPRRVVAEIAAGHDGAEIVQVLGADARFSTLDDTVIPSTVAAWNLGPGESQVSSHRVGQSSVVAVLDDRAARQCARSLGISVVERLGVMSAAKRKGWIPSACPIVGRLVDDGLYLSGSLVAAALAEAGE